MSACIRPALSSDIPDLSRLYVEFHQFHVKGVPGRLVGLEHMEPLEMIALADNLRAVLDDPHAAVYVAEIDGTACGFAEVYDQKTDPHPLRVQRRFLYIQSLYVRKAVRRQHVGQALLKAACAWGQQRGLREIQLDAWEFPGGPRQFYETMGLTTLRRTLVGKIDLDRDEHAK
jgi:ribosomal protein S18 acetylase RimI-like enzyme